MRWFSLVFENCTTYKKKCQSHQQCLTTRPTFTNDDQEYEVPPEELSVVPMVAAPDQLGAALP